MAQITVSAISGVNDSTVGAESWLNPSRVTADDGLNAFYNNTTGSPPKTTHYLRAAPASLASIPTTATIDGIRVDVERSSSGAVADNSIRLRKNGAYLGDEKAVAVTWQSSETKVYGGSTDLWGTTWTRNDIVNGLAFGISANIFFEDDEARIDHIEFTIYYTLPLPKAIQANTDSGWTGSGSIVADHPIQISQNADWTGSGSLVVRRDLEASLDVNWNGSSTIAGGLRSIASLIDTDWLGSGSLAGFIKLLSSNVDVNWSGAASLDSIKRTIANINTNWNSQGSITFDYNFNWSIEHLEASTTHGFSSVYVDVSNTAQPTGGFPSGDSYDRKLLEVPRLQEVNLNSRSGVSGFQRVTLQVDNSDGIINSINLQDAYVRMFFVDDAGDVYKEFNGKVVDWTLSHVVTINVEDIDALAFTEDLPKRTLNDLIDGEKAVLTGQELTEFENSVVADDLGNPIPIIFGRAVKVPLLYVKADETLVGQESKREYDYIIGEGVGLNGNNFEEIFTVYREEQALDNHSFTTPSAGTTLTIPLSTSNPDLRRPSGWYNYWWVFVDGEVRYVESYNGDTNTITLDSALPSAPPAGTAVELREWRFYDGSQTSPYQGYAFIRFKKRLGTTSRTDDLYADVNGLQDEVNRVRAIESILSNSAWGLGLDVDSGVSGTFDTAATEISNDVGNFTCEGAILRQSSVTDILSKLLSFRDMVLSKSDKIQIVVDDTKSMGFNFGLGDETGYNNILDTNPQVTYIHPNEKVKDLKVRYRKNHRENDVFLHEFTRSSSANGVDDTLDLPFVYDHQTADRALDYKRKRLASAEKTLSLSVGEDGKQAKRGDRVNVNIPTLGLSSDWEVTGSNVSIAGSNNLDLVPYSGTPYTYESFTSGGGTLPVDESFDIPPDFSNTIPEPVTGVVANGGTYTTETGDRLGFVDITWSTPQDGNYLDAEVLVTRSALPANYISRGFGESSFRVEGLNANDSYNVLVVSRNEAGLKGLGTEQTNIATGTAPSPPGIPSAPTGVRSGRTVTFNATPPSSTHPIKNFDWEVDFTFGGTDYSVNEHGTTLSVTVSGTSSFSVRARLRARNIYDQTSSYSTYSSIVSNEQWQSGHIGNDQINSQHYANLSIDEAHIGTAQITEAKIRDLAVKEAKIGNAEIKTAKIDDLQVETIKIGNNQVDFFKRQNVVMFNTTLGPVSVTGNNTVRANGTRTHNLMAGPLLITVQWTDNFHLLTSQTGNIPAIDKLMGVAHVTSQTINSFGWGMEIQSSAGNAAFNGAELNATFYYW